MAEQINTLSDAVNFLDAPEPAELAPKTSAATSLVDAASQLGSNLAGQSSVERLIQENARPGIPLQVNPEDDNPFGNIKNPWIRFQVARRQNIADQWKYLETQFPGKVRKAANSDDFIIEMQDDKTGKKKDVLLNEDQITLGDLSALAGQSPEIAFSLLAAAGSGGMGAALSKGPGLVKGMVGSFMKSNLGRVIAGSLGYSTGKAVEQVVTELEQGQTPDIEKIAGEVGQAFPMQATLDMGTFGVFKTASMMNRVRKGGPGMFQTTVHGEGLPANERLKSKFGIGFDYTGAESSGMPVLAFLEAYAEAKPQSTPIMRQFKDAHDAQRKAIADAMTSGAGTDEAAGKALMDQISGYEKIKQEALDKVRQTMTSAEESLLNKQLGQVGNVVPNFKPSVGGSTVRTSVQDAHKGVKSRVGTAYEEAYARPNVQDPVVPTKSVTDEIDGLLKRFSATGDIQWLKDYKSTIPTTEPYRNLVQRRSELWNMIENSPADKSTKDYVYGQLSNAMTQTMDDATKNILDPQFRGLIQKANGIYKNVERPFYQSGIADILRKAGEPGSPENIELLNRFKNNTDLYRKLVGVVGANDPAVETVKSAVIDGLLTKSGKTAIDPQWVDASKFIENLKELSSNPKTREMFQDIFGSRGKDLLEQAKIMSAIQGNLSKEDALALLSGVGPTASKRRLSAVIAAQEQLDKVEARRLLEGPVDKIHPEEFVNRFADKLTETETKSLANKLKTDAPALYEQLVAKRVEQILGKSGTYETWSRSSLENVLNDPKMKPKYQAFLGSRYDDLVDFAKAMGPIQYADEMAQGTGMLVKGQSIGALSRIFKYEPGKGNSKVGEILREVPPWVGWKAASHFITSDGFRNWAAQKFPKDSANYVMRTLIAEPIAEELASSSHSPEVVRNIALAVRSYASRANAPRPQEQPAPQIKSMKEAFDYLDR